MTQYKYRINGKEYEVTINSVSEDGAQVTVNGKAYGVEIVKDDWSQKRMHHPFL
jgi:hypothetical protein